LIFNHLYKYLMFLGRLYFGLNQNFNLKKDDKIKTYRTFVITEPAALPVDQRTTAGLFFISMAQQFNKPPLSADDHIVLLKSRGLVVENQDTAKHYLSNIGYYRLAGYWFHFQEDTVKHIFREGVTFEQIIDAYSFDRSLRLLIFDAIERIEVGFRTHLSNIMCHSHGAFWFENEKLFNQYFQDNITSIDKELSRSKEDFIEHHRQKYGKDRPPSWKTLEVMSLGNLSMLYASLLSPTDKNQVARALGLPNYTYLESWMQSLSTLRNCCAHHCRIWKKLFQFPPKKLLTAQRNWIVDVPDAHWKMQKLYYQICTIKYLLDVISPGNSLSSKLKSLIAKYPTIDIASLGFTKKWEAEPLWQ